MPLKLLFVSSPSQDTEDRFLGAPTSLLYVIAPLVDAIKRGEIKIDCYPIVFERSYLTDGCLKKFENLLKREKIDAVAIITTYDSLYPAVRMAETAKMTNPSAVMVLGGSHFDEASKFRELNDVINYPRLFDFGVSGDAEYALKKLFEVLSLYEYKSIDEAKENVLKSESGFRELDGISELHLMSGGEYIKIESRGKPLEPDDLPLIDRNLIERMHRYGYDIFRNAGGHILPTAQLMTHRGCKSKCPFCSESGGYSERSVEAIVEEAKLLKSEGYRALFLDDSTVNHYSKLDEVSEKLSDLGFKRGGLTRFDELLEYDTTKTMADNGFKYIYCAVEQYDNEVLGQMNKRLITDDMDHAMDNIEDSGIRLGISTLFGFDFETEESIMETISYVKKKAHSGAVELISASLLSIHPNTFLAYLREKEGKGKVTSLCFDTPCPHQGFPWNRFEEGGWYHPEHVTGEYAERLALKLENEVGRFLARNRGLHKTF